MFGKKFSRLVSSQINKNESKIFFCEWCIQHFSNEKTLKQHQEYCKNHESRKTVYANEGDVEKFRNFQKIHYSPFIIIVDSECALEKTHNQISSKVLQYQKHEPSGFCYLILCFDNNLYKPKLVRLTKKSKDENISLKFIKHLEKDIRKICQKFSFPAKIIFGENEEKDFENADKCHACKEKFKKEYVIQFDKKDESAEFIKFENKVKDHCHYIGKCCGAACISCNSRMRRPKFLPVVFHGLKNYDSHLFINELGKTDGEISCIAKTEETYISFSKNIIVNTFYSKKYERNFDDWREIRFIDSCGFMDGSLSALTSYLEPEDFDVLKHFYKNEEDRKLLSRKGVFPYDCFDNFEKLNEGNLPSIEEFYSKLNDKNITEEDYEHAKNVWNHFQMKSMRDYHDLYLETDVILLADVFQNFRKIGMKHYQLDPAWYYTSPGLAWDAMLKITQVELELIPNSKSNMYLMIEKGIRGAICCVSKK